MICKVFRTKKTLLFYYCIQKQKVFISKLSLHNSKIFHIKFCRWVKPPIELGLELAEIRFRASIANPWFIADYAHL